MRQKVISFPEYEKWEPKKVVEWIVACRKDYGVPMFKSHYARLHYQVKGKPAVLAICWGGYDGTPSVMFTDVPKEDLELIEESIGDWRKLLRKYGTPEELEEAESYGIYLKGYKLPKFR